VRRLAAAALLLCACGREPQEADRRPGEPARVSLSTSALAMSVQPQPLPGWTQRAPEIVARGSRRYARAVGAARTGDLGLSRSAAQDRARLQIAQLLHGKASVVGRTVAVEGAQIVQSHTAGDGTVYVELEAPVHR
jgi:hypothetical protein